MAIIRSAESPNGGEHLAALGLLCGIMCSMLVLKMKGFSAIFHIQNDGGGGGGDPSTPVVASRGVYRQYNNERYENGSTTITYKPIDRVEIQLPLLQPAAPLPVSVPQPGSSYKNAAAPPPPPLPTSPPPLPTSQAPQFASPLNVSLPDNAVSLDPRGRTIDRVDSTDLRISSKAADSKLSKKEKKEIEKAEKERIKEQKKKDKILIAQILKDDMERTIREANLLNKRKKDEAKALKSKGKNKSTAAKTKEPTKPPPQKAANPLAQGNPTISKDTLQSSISTSSGPPPYSTTDRNKPPPEGTPSQSDSSGNTSFSKPVDNSTWDMVSQHRQQMRRPGPSAAKVDTNQHSSETKPSEVKLAPPRKSLYV